MEIGVFGYVEAMGAVERVGSRAQDDGRGGDRGRLALSMDLPASRMPSHELRQWVRAALYREDPDCAEKVWLALAELAANAHDHGRSPVQVRVWRSTAPPAVRVEVEDACREVPVPGASRRDGTRGSGLVLVDALARRWGVDVHATGKTVWAEWSAVQPEPDPARWAAP
ncbi:anti-sigma regulatory factor (Ser/Thr protein kinase) [Saccharothrix carnea]|uniref:Anti-sigma regulatory factor (Ser/Thr protein kinase) n=1 Tax=Saccharothrix carnea TaxID=1280637 RepID=A0A2P8I1I0_SACCR|nr:ATP-binding protein [Saccharothrix carnea]PSL52315.1 anti-sigma regulatory factor (Ser/Thr protein kinase) [Saccharothrix carnea]